jgi:hypothetical protein
MTDQAPEATDVAEDALLLAVKGLDARLEKLEAEDKKTLLKMVTTSASTSALLLGLVLTFASLYDVFIAKPEADRISRISQFNQAVNSAAKTRQELVQLQMQTSDNQLKLAAAQIATPRVLNDISTARVILKDLKDEDVGVPQLIVLTSEAFTAGDWESAKLFVERAVAKTDVSPFLRSEAKRYEARYFYASGQLAQGRRSYESALSTIGESQASAAARAYILADFSLAERTFGDCPNAIAVLQRFATAVNVPGVFADARAQLVETVRAQINQWPQGTCPLPDNLAALKGP